MSMDDLLKELQLEYIQGLPEKIQELKTFSDQKDFQNLLNAFHKLKGSGKTYGLEEVSALGQFFEGWLREKKEKAIPFTKKASEILERIHSSRSNDKPYSLDTDTEFQNLKSLK
jgi:HPt (histidine-containing phosphotransfer) domain-containing protein